MNTNFSELLTKYDKPIPRYTSYPTVPYWNFDTLTVDSWLHSVKSTFHSEKKEMSLYIHLPFCEHLCTFCACNKRITVNHKVEDPYIQTVLKEWKMYLRELGEKPILREIHLGGGTPTFFSPYNLQILIRTILEDVIVPNDHEFSIEVHPNFTTEKHLEVLAELGFNRISLGVQDFDPNVQYIINRPQSFEVTKEVIDWAIKHKYKSINIDLIYGLPKQTIESVDFTIEKVNELNPDRIAFYSYAHVPWKSKGQRRYEDEDVPKAIDKWKMYEHGRKMLEKNKFSSIGMDHFAKQDDKLFTAYHQGKLHRNFMGYTTTNNKLILGLGTSSISDSWNGFAQNAKVVEDYEKLIHEGKFPLENGHLLSEEDAIIRQTILDLMCRDKAQIPTAIYSSEILDKMLQEFSVFEQDGLIKIENNEVKIQSSGQTFIRNISSVFDLRLRNKTTEGSLFSKSI